MDPSAASPASALSDLATEQPSLAKAAIGGSFAAVIGGTIWATIASTSGYEIGWIAIGIGFLCGFGVRILGKGSTTPFRVLGAGTALFGIVLGKVMTIAWLAHRQGEDIGLADEIALMKATFSPIDVLFYGIALWEGWKFAADEQ